MLALLCARTGDTIDRVKQYLQASDGLTLVEGLTRDRADEILASLPADGSVEITVQREVDSWVAVLMGYRPGSRGRLRVAIQKMSRLSTEEVIHFLANIPVALKTGVSRKTAEAIKEILERDGGIIEIRPHTGIPNAETTGSEKVSSPSDQISEEKIHGEADHVSTEPPGSEPDVPPLVAEIAASLKPVMNVKPPPVFSFIPPEKEAVSAPPLPDQDNGAGDRSPAPFPFKFTIPARPVPPLVYCSADDDPPETTEDARVVPIYLHPVAQGQKERVCKILTESLGMKSERSMQLVNKAPVAVWACAERLNALVTLRGLSEKGVPVSLFPGSSKKQDNSYGPSFFGWMNGKQ